MQRRPLLALGFAGLFSAAALAQEVNAQLAKPATREALAAQGLVLWTLSPAQLDAHIRRETALWAAIIKNRKITAE